jgi:hypothetical protein
MNPDIIGDATLIWGTDGQNLGLTGAIVESATITPKNQDPIEIEDNNGFAKILVLLKDGFNGKLDFVYDKDITWPAEGDVVAFTIAKTGAAGGTEDFDCVVTSMPQQFTKKKEAMISINLVYRPNVVLPA